ncbi:FAD-dependent oxidoreductase [Rhodococcus pseudokoreensis]|uniref:FAD-dependent oxidoreductase n=1 Tax=Rhodococcus pseudokoreensis TaxID=2811421 RepID=A0A974ZVY6_9NOCA|nr:FAD-dependent oxidoreductase [Rhodococcus pseudokoreensis]QSE92036.1 FAD-dependent oxidoreductase [Rhodococcus pseudokoreensis]
MRVSDSDFDVVVIGAGAAGLAAALSAVEQGCERVLISEATGVVGGSSRLAGGVVMGSGSELQRKAGVEDDPSDLFKEYMSLNHWDVAAGPVKRLTARSGETIDWLSERGVTFFDRLIFGGDERKPRSHCVDGGGQALVNALWSACQRAGVDVALGHRVDQLLTDGDRVTGVIAEGETITADAVVIATGGFGANPDLLQKYFPSSWTTDWTWYIGADGSRGDAIGFAEQLGAQLTGFDRGLRTLDPHFAKLNEAFLPGWTVLLDASGRRFCDETAPYGILDTLVRARGNRAFVVFDDAALRPPADQADRYRDCYKQVWPNHPPFRPKNYTADLVDENVATGKAKAASDLPALAEAIGVPVETLEGEVARYNALAIEGEDTDFGKAGKFLLPLSTPPFYAVEVRPATVNVTSCGLRIDQKARVLRQDGAAIDGLYAAGECTGGILGETYMGSGNSLANACGFGRIAGEEAAHKAKSGAAS